MNQREDRPAAGRDLVLFKACRGGEGGCPHGLIEPGQAARALRRTLEQDGTAESLTARLGDKAPHHKKLKIALAACPNSCSQPQIADLALVAKVFPRLARPRDCTGCGSCAAACGDQAIELGPEGPIFDPQKCLGCKVCQKACPEGCLELSPPSYLLLAGGRLGRRPRLARQVLGTPKLAEALEQVSALLEQYLAEPGDLPRFADWWAQREHGGE